MDKKVNPPWITQTLHLLTHNSQDIPSLLTDLCTAMEECPWSRPGDQVKIHAWLSGLVRHGAYAAWAAVATDTVAWTPFVGVPQGIQRLGSGLYARALAIEGEKLLEGRASVEQLRTWGAVFGALPERLVQGKLIG